MTQERLYIWGDTIPGNRPDSKTDIMDIHEEYTMEEIFGRPGVWDKENEDLGDMSGNATMVYRQEIEHGPGKMTYEDEPFLVPYLVDNSEQVVILCPGGAYLTKSMIEEGKDVAEALNKAGISAFVLWYRSYPYYAPIMYWDAQRAIRYMRYHATEFGINPDKISVAGFSAGGNLAGVTSFVLRNTAVEYEGYVPDEIDQVDTSLASLGLIYPAIEMANDKMLAVMAGVDVYQDESKRHVFAEQYDMRNHVQENDAPLFLCAAIDDEVVSAEHLLTLAKLAKGKNIPTDLHLFSEGGHGFGACLGEQMPQFYHDRTLVQQWLDLYITWLKQTVK